MGRGFTSLILPAEYTLQMLSQESRLLGHVLNTTSYFFVKLQQNKSKTVLQRNCFQFEEVLQVGMGEGMYCAEEMSSH